MFYISESDSDQDDYPSSSYPRRKEQEPDISQIVSNPFSQGGSKSSGQIDSVQQQKLQRMKQAAQRQSQSQVSMMTSSGMRSNRNSYSSQGTRVQSFESQGDISGGGFNDQGPGIRDETRKQGVEEYTLQDDERNQPRFSMPNNTPPQQQQQQRPPQQAPPQNNGPPPQQQQQQPQQGNKPGMMGEEIVPSSLANSNPASIGEKQGNSDLERQLMNRGMSAAVYESGQNTKPQEQNRAQRQSGLPELDVSDRAYFLSHPIPKEYGMVKCYIQREKGKFKLFPKYHLYFENGNKFLLSARKRKKNKSSNYLLSLEKTDLARDSPNFFGKLRANFLGTEFVMFDGGDNPKNAKEPQSVRHELGAILYETNILGMGGPRRLNIITPAVGPDGEFLTQPQLKGNPSLIQNFKDGKRGNMHVFTNKRPSWNEKLKAYVLNFNGRVTQASVKNFQLVEEGDNDTVMLQFGKVSTNRFTLDFRYPLSPMQAFSIALSAYDFKLMCE